MGTVYLIHFDRAIGDTGNPHGYARHYLGYSDDLEARLSQHRRGNGSALMAAVAEAGIGWQVVRTWEGDRALERRLKGRKESPRLCPVCNPGAMRLAAHYGSTGFQGVSDEQS